MIRTCIHLFRMAHAAELLRHRAQPAPEASSSRRCAERDSWRRWAVFRAGRGPAPCRRDGSPWGRIPWCPGGPWDAHRGRTCSDAPFADGGDRSRADHGRACRIPQLQGHAWTNRRGCRRGRFDRSGRYRDRACPAANDVPLLLGRRSHGHRLQEGHRVPAHSMRIFFLLTESDN